MGRCLIAFGTAGPDALSSGTRLGPYTLQASVGTGGMGEVYFTVDTRLGRAVAIKVLPAHLTDAVDALGRFEQETRAVAALNHPNIFALHDVGRDAPGLARLVARCLEKNPADRPEADAFARGLPVSPVPISHCSWLGSTSAASHRSSQLRTAAAATHV